jgi:hypothetical protein
MIRRMIGRFLAICGWLAWQVSRPAAATPLRALGSALPAAVGIVLLVVAALPILVPRLDPQPQDVTVQEILDGAVAETSGWVRLRGRITPLSESPTGESGSFALFVDEANPMRAVVLRTAADPDAAASAMVTGHLAEAGILVEEELPLEATVFGSPPRIVADRVVDADPVPKPVRASLWAFSLLPAVLGVLILVGSRAGYPVFRPASEVDVLAGPIGPGERLPAAYGGRIGPNERVLADPGGALLLVRSGPQGDLLTAQPLPDDGAVAPAPVTIGGSWTSGRLGYVHTVSETVPALAIRSELVDATFLFARTAERDRVAALVSVDR